MTRFHLTAQNRPFDTQAGRQQQLAEAVRCEAKCVAQPI